jgi:hypothetical protein
MSCGAGHASRCNGVVCIPQRQHSPLYGAAVPGRLDSEVLGMDMPVARRPPNYLRRVHSASLRRIRALHETVRSSMERSTVFSASVPCLMGRRPPRAGPCTGGASPPTGAMGWFVTGVPAGAPGLTRTLLSRFESCSTLASIALCCLWSSTPVSKFHYPLRFKGVLVIPQHTSTTQPNQNSAKNPILTRKRTGIHGLNVNLCCL